MSTSRRTFGSRVVRGLVVALVILAGLAFWAGTEAGRVMAADLLGLALWLLVVAAGLATLVRRLRAPSIDRRDSGSESDTEWADRMRQSPTYELLPGNYWFRGLTTRDPMDDR